MSDDMETANPDESLDNQIKETHSFTKKYGTYKLISNILFGTMLIFIAYFPIRFVSNEIGLEHGILRDLFTFHNFIFVAFFSTIVHILFINSFFDTLSTYSYLTKTLHTKISISDAAFLKQLFEPSLIETGGWVSMQNIIALPENLRRKAVMDTAKKILDEKEEERKALEAKELEEKALAVATDAEV
jgi:hypothetical protein